MSKPLGKRGYCSSIRMDEVLSDEEMESLYRDRHMEPAKVQRLIATVESLKEEVAKLRAEIERRRKLTLELSGRLEK